MVRFSLVLYSTVIVLFVAHHSRGIFEKVMCPRLLDNHDSRYKSFQVETHFEFNSLTHHFVSCSIEIGIPCRVVDYRVVIHSNGRSMLSLRLCRIWSWIKWKLQQIGRTSGCYPWWYRSKPKNRVGREKDPLTCSLLLPMRKRHPMEERNERQERQIPGRTISRKKGETSRPMG